MHVDRDNLPAKFWLTPVALASKLGFWPSELRRVQAIIEENQELLVERWREFFGD